ncbi:MAG: hypothetical protein LBS36_11440 [Oscillospiraceae bacterium]|jgi:hypothetical protein|nr:hypothetical protein [Oscillospiraceae bacterium]
MRIKLFAVDAKSVRSALILRTRVAAAFRPYSQEVLSFSEFASFAEMASPLDAALKGCEIVVVLVSLQSYAKTKELLLRSMHLKTEHRFDLFERVQNELGDVAMSSSEASVHIEFPVDATVFETENGLFSGFCAHGKKQDVFFLPYDEAVTPYLLKTGVAGHLKQLSFDHKCRTSRVRFLHDDICGILAEAGMQVAVAATPASRFIFLPGNKIEGFQRYFRPYEAIGQRGKQALDKYTVKLAIDASRETGCAYGIALSNIASTGEGDGRRLYYAVASRKTFASSCLTASFSSDETDKIEDFLAEGVNSLFALLKKRLYEENSILRRRP